MTDQELIDTVCPIIRDLGATFYGAPATFARGAALGLDRWGTYIMGRAGVLGDVEAAVVVSAFGYFNPQVLEQAWKAGCEKVSPRVAGREYSLAAAEHGRAKLIGVPGIDAFVAAGEKVLAECNGDSMPLFAGVAAEPAAADAPGRAMQLLAILREYRGGAHLIALRSLGLDSKTAHHVKRPNDTAMFGWKPEDAPVIDDVVRAKMVAAEELTDRLVVDAYAVLSAGERQAFVDTLRACQAALSA